MKDKNKYLNYFVFLSTGGLYFSIFLLVFFSSISYNPVKSKVPSNIEIRKFFPQGWAFFTRDPNEVRLKLYRVDTLNKTLKEVTPIQNSHISNCFGLIKESRFKFFELGQITKEINAFTWENVDSLKYGVTEDMVVNSIGNRFEEATMKGLYIIQLQKPVPWSWRKSEDNIEMPSKISKVMVK